MLRASSVTSNKSSTMESSPLPVLQVSTSLLLSQNLLFLPVVKKSFSLENS